MGEFRKLFESVVNGNMYILSLMEEYFDDVILDGDIIIIENVENISVNKESRKLKVNDSIIENIGCYNRIKKEKDKVIIEFEKYIFEYHIKPASKLIINVKK